MTGYIQPCGCFHKDRQDLRVDGRAPNIFEMTIQGLDGAPPVEVEFLGNVYQEIEHEGVDSNGYQFAHLRVLFFSVWGDHPTLGRLQIVQDHSRPGTYGRILASKIGEKFPAIHTTHLNVVAFKPDAPGFLMQNRGDPLVFKSEPMMDWPPANNIYRLGLSIEFENRASPGIPILSIGKSAVYVESS